MTLDLWFRECSSCRLPFDKGPPFTGRRICDQCTLAFRQLNPTRWIAQEYEGEWHVFPENGPRHELSMECWCDAEQRDAVLIVHKEAS